MVPLVDLGVDASIEQLALLQHAADYGVDASIEHLAVLSYVHLKLRLVLALLYIFDRISV
jgi:hypothetical protein